MSRFKIVLYNPQIPGNTGSIGRTCLALNLELILIYPLGFDVGTKAVRRAGLDYWKFIKLKTFEDWSDFIRKENPPDDLLFFFSKKSSINLFKAKFFRGSYLIFGSETTGLPLSLTEKHSEKFFSLPMFSHKIRSLNLANVVTATSYECLRQIEVDL